MPNHSSHPTTVTVMVSSHPLLVVNTTPQGENAVDVDLVYKEPEDVETAIIVLQATVQACQYFIWKHTGVLPRPPDMVEQLPIDGTDEHPF